MTIVFAVLWILFVVMALVSLSREFSASALVAFIGGFIGLSKALLDSLSKDNLRVYFFFHRLRIRWHSQAVTRWWFAARYDGEYSREILPQILRFLNDKTQFKFSVQLDFQNERELQAQIAETLIVRISFDEPDDLPDARAHVTLISKTIEVSYGYTKAKLERQIIPVLEALKTFLKPDRCSYELNVDFTGANPFFAVYVNHLRPDQIGDFNVVLKLDAYSASSTSEKVVISKNKVHVTALSTESFQRLAVDFILLSPDVRALAGVMRA